MTCLVRRSLLVLTLLATPAFAQDEPKPEQLKKMYDEALSQLKSVQDRRNQLANENEQLAAKVKELEARLATAQAEAAELRKEAAGYAEKTYYLRAHYAAWREFLQRYPEIVSRWRLFLGSNLSTPRPTNETDAWPFEMAG
jgi:septal ring factor EnvC (AmiA/AmiB activator)